MNEEIVRDTIQNLTNQIANQAYQVALLQATNASYIKVIEELKKQIENSNIETVKEPDTNSTGGGMPIK